MRDESPNPDPQPDIASIEDETAMADELTGRAAATDEDLISLFGNKDKTHVDDGFRGGSDDDTNVAPSTQDDDPADSSTGGLKNL